MELLSSLPTALVPVALVLYFSDRNTKDWMAERRDIALAILAERKEFIATQAHLLERYDARLVAAVEAMSKVQSEVHSLKSTLTQFMLTLDNARRPKE